jgi:hypothetical protein
MFSRIRKIMAPAENEMAPIAEQNGAWTHPKLHQSFQGSLYLCIYFSLAWSRINNTISKVFSYAMFQTDPNDVLLLVQHLIEPRCKIRFTQPDGHYFKIRTYEEKQQLLFPIYTDPHTTLVPLSVSHRPLQRIHGTGAIVGREEFVRRLQSLREEEPGLTWSVCPKSRKLLRQWQNLVTMKRDCLSENTTH